MRLLQKDVRGYFVFAETFCFISTETQSIASRGGESLYEKERLLSKHGQPLKKKTGEKKHAVAACFSKCAVAVRAFGSEMRNSLTLPVLEF